MKAVTEICKAYWRWKLPGGGAGTYTEGVSTGLYKALLILNNGDSSLTNRMLGSHDPRNKPLVTSYPTSLDK